MMDLEEEEEEEVQLSLLQMSANNQRRMIDRFRERLSE